MLEKLEQKIDSRFDRIEEQFVRKSEFEPIKAVVYGMVGLILLSVLGAMVAVVVKSTAAASEVINWIPGR
jgi:hypothetical protein